MISSNCSACDLLFQRAFTQILTLTNILGRSFDHANLATIQLHLMGKLWIVLKPPKGNLPWHGWEGGLTLTFYKLELEASMLYRLLDFSKRWNEVGPCSTQLGSRLAQASYRFDQARARLAMYKNFFRACLFLVFCSGKQRCFHPSRKKLEKSTFGWYRGK